MTKREMIDDILTINRSAGPEFLSRFNDDELYAYLQHLRQVNAPRLSGDPHRYDKYFQPARQAAAVAVAEIEDGSLDTQEEKWTHPCRWESLVSDAAQEQAGVEASAPRAHLNEVREKLERSIRRLDVARQPAEKLLF